MEKVDGLDIRRVLRVHAARVDGLAGSKGAVLAESRDNVGRMVVGYKARAHGSGGGALGGSVSRAGLVQGQKRVHGNLLVFLDRGPGQGKEETGSTVRDGYE